MKVLVLIIIFVEEQTTNGVLENIDLIVNILSGLAVLIGGVFATLFFKTLREKSLNATFGYFSRLKVRMNSLLHIFTNNSTEILNRLFIPDGERREDDPQKTAFIDELISKFSKEAKETREFLKKEDDQMPGSRNWVDNYTTFLEFLEDCENLQNPMYYKNIEASEINEYYKTHTENMKAMLNAIDIRQKELENKLCKRHSKKNSD